MTKDFPRYSVNGRAFGSFRQACDFAELRAKAEGGRWHVMQKLDAWTSWCRLRTFA